MTKVAIVILNWNGKHYLEKYLSDVVKHSTTNENKVIVVDNNSTDESVNYLKTNFSENVELIEFDNNYGYAGGYQKALEIIKAEYYVLLNSDVEVTPGWVEPIIELMDSDKTIAASMPKIRAYEKKERFEYAGASGGYIDKFGFPFCRGRILYSIEDDTNQYDSVADIFWASGAAMFVRADAYHKAGGLDDNFFAHMEEIDLCWRMKHLGYRITCCPQSLVYHVGGGTLPNNSPRKLYLNYRNSLFLLYKNLSRKKFHRTIYLRMLIDAASAMVYFLRFDFSFFSAVTKAHRDFYKSLPLLREKRSAVMQQMQIPEVSAIYMRSIVFSFFLKRRRIFKDLKLQYFSKN